MSELDFVQALSQTLRLAAVALCVIYALRLDNRVLAAGFLCGLAYITPLALGAAGLDVPADVRYAATSLAAAAPVLCAFGLRDALRKVARDRELAEHLLRARRDDLGAP